MSIAITITPAWKTQAYERGGKKFSEARARTKREETVRAFTSELDRLGKWRIGVKTTTSEIREVASPHESNAQKASKQQESMDHQKGYRSAELGPSPGTEGPGEDTPCCWVSAARFRKLSRWND